jgi:toxin CcdB
MARFDLYRDRTGAVSCLLDVQASFLDRLPTRLVVPLLAEAGFRGFVQHLHLRVEVEGAAMIMATNLMAAVPRGRLGARVGSLESRHDELVAAIDFLLQGF